MSSLASFYERQNEPVRSCMLAVRALILAQDDAITTGLKYGMLFFSYKGKMFCYLWFHKKFRQTYIGFVEGHRFDEPGLLQEKRSRIKIFLLDMNKDLPKGEIEPLLQKALSFYKSGMIPVKDKKIE
ncbi:MAG: DUF1801 domain-containing protein [Sphingobacteriales bacterium]|nr:MAG: DUF1801 domain-containing protein [Sphingobacteriales bacterium]